MFLKSLTMKGFKSFADTTVLDFEPGVTVVVGPNGSGKSNVVDAIAWVLGAQGPRTVRSQKMDDVVFAGAAKRPALGRAEVSMLLDNSSGILPIDFTEVTITRTLYRNGDSEYAMNGVACRLLDIQELLSDAGVGRQQHVIIAQGQIDQVLNARPEDRRTIIEEAAGILKFRRRKERADRRLDATEANLLRLQDLQREVRRQLRPLEKQADAARRHGAVTEELRALRLHLAGRELASLQGRLSGVESERAVLADEDRTLRSQLQELDMSVMSAESQLSAFGDGLGEALPRYESLRERCRGLSALVAERRRGLERDRGSLLAEDIVATLEADHADLTVQLSLVDTEAEAMAPDVDRLTEAEIRLAADQEAFATDRDGFTPDTSGKAAEVRGELTAVRASLARAEAELIRLDERLDALLGRDSELEFAGEGLRAELTSASENEPMLVAALDAAETDVVEAKAALEAAESAERAGQAQIDRWAARSGALRLALDDARSRAGVERLDGLAGVVGTLADLIDIDHGWELAFEAAAGDAMAAVIVQDATIAREALRKLAAADASGAVLALGAPSNPVTTPLVGRPLRDHVRSTSSDVESLLDRLVGSAVVVDGDWTTAVDTALAYPDVVVVTQNGDRCGLSGWRIGAAGSGATAAAFEEAEREAKEAEIAHATAAQAAAGARALVTEALVRADAGADALDLHDGKVARASEELARLERERRDATGESETRSGRRVELAIVLDRDRARVAELEELLPGLLDAEESVREAGAELDRARDALDQRARAVAALRSDLGVRAAGLEERRGVLLRRLEDVERRLASHAAEREGAAGRREKLDTRLLALDRLGAFVEERSATVLVELERLREQRRQQSAASRAVSDQLDTHRLNRAETAKRQDEVRELLGRLDVQEAEVKLRLENLVGLLRTELDAEPAGALAAELPAIADGTTPAARVRELDRDLKRMGPINPLALEEHHALSERHDFVSEQLDDVRKSRRELTKVILAIDEEIVRIFAAAVADVSENFERVFQTLFPGGEGKLKLTDPTDLLATGIEIEARPSGKNVRKLSLLSGGERSLTALAFLFAIFQSRPSPFYVMDEVEAALDDVNLHRFLDLVAEFRREAQLVIVSHQKRTMEAADCLYGVSMPPGGSSRVVSEKIA